ncbi:hypothetical protein FA95DRAFT_174496 [Auriscalpium vulgare]|uniref:Uncharacterized protein n=1 Tax=Auriscalpium vulgare TaxID=40419 RepID=A0ACB8RLP8_9AGAM|nr:hypothetical protein FA95DRAFT_174496 [Auriscalpium vulgare]
MSFQSLRTRSSADPSCRTVALSVSRLQRCQRPEHPGRRLYFLDLLDARDSSICTQAYLICAQLFLSQTTVSPTRCQHPERHLCLLDLIPAREPPLSARKPPRSARKDSSRKLRSHPQAADISARPSSNLRTLQHPTAQLRSARNTHPERCWISIKPGLAGHIQSLCSDILDCRDICTPSFLIPFSFSFPPWICS